MVSVIFSTGISMSAEQRMLEEFREQLIADATRDAGSQGMVCEIYWRAIVVARWHFQELKRQHPGTSAAKLALQGEENIEQALKAVEAATIAAEAISQASRAAAMASQAIVHPPVHMKRRCINLANVVRRIFRRRRTPDDNK